MHREKLGIHKKLLAINKSEEKKKAKKESEFFSAPTGPDSIALII